MALPTFTAGTTALAADVQDIVNHLQGGSGKTDAWHFRCSTGNNYLITLADAAGARTLSVRDSALVEVFSVNSDGDVTTSGVLAPNSLTFPSSAAPAPTVEGRAIWDTDDNLLSVGDGAASQILIPSPTTTAGDVEYASGARAHSRLAIGTTGVGATLKVNSAGTAPEWTNVFKRKSATQVLTTDTTFVAVTASTGNFDFTCGASEVWLLEYGIYLTFGGTGGVQFQLTGPAVPTAVFAVPIVPVNALDSVSVQLVSPNTKMVLVVDPVVTAFNSAMISRNSGASGNTANILLNNVGTVLVIIKATIINGVNASNLQLQVGQNSANSTTTLGIGSWMRAEKVA